MTTFPLSALVDPLKVEELFQKIENRKKLEQMLLDPRVVELSRQSPQSRQALAAVVRRLQEERARKRRIRNAEQKEEPVVKWFDCINFLKNFSPPPRQPSRQSRRSSPPALKQTTRSTPNLESAGLPEPIEETPAFFMTSHPITTPEMSVCIPNMSKNKDSPLPRGVMDLFSSDKGRSLISSLINGTELKKLFRIKTILPTQSHQLWQCVDCLDYSVLQCVQYGVPKKNVHQSFIVLTPRASRDTLSQLAFDGHWGKMKAISSATQTAYSVSCSRCNSNCISTDSFSSYMDEREVNIKRNNFPMALCKKNNMIKCSKSQSAMYTTDYSECDCDGCSSPDEICGGKFLSRILTHALPPKIDYLTTPDVLVTYSGKGNASDSSSSNSSCKACKGNISSESVQLEPRQIWTQKRLKTSCESCLNTFRNEFIRKSRYSKDLAKFSNRTPSSGSLSSDESSQEEINNEFRGLSEEFYVQAKSILESVGQKGNVNQFDLKKDVSIYEERMILEETMKYEVEMKNDKSLVGNQAPSIEYDLVLSDSNDKPCESAYESTAQSLAPMIDKDLSSSSDEKEQNSSSETPKTQLDGGSIPPKVDNPSIQDCNPLTSDVFGSTTSPDDSDHTSSFVTRSRKQRKRVRNKCDSVSGDDSSSSSSMPKFRTFPRRSKPKLCTVEAPTIQQQNLLQKLSKQKSKKKNCAIM